MPATEPMPTRPDLVAVIGRWAEAHKTGMQMSSAGAALTHALDLVYGRVQWLERYAPNAFGFPTDASPTPPQNG